MTLTSVVVILISVDINTCVCVCVVCLGYVFGVQRPVFPSGVTCFYLGFPGIFHFYSSIKHIANDKRMTSSSLPLSLSSFKQNRNLPSLLSLSHLPCLLLSALYAFLICAYISLREILCVRVCVCVCVFQAYCMCRENIVYIISTTIFNVIQINMHLYF